MRAGEYLGYVMGSDRLCEQYRMTGPWRLSDDLMKDLLMDRMRYVTRFEWRREVSLRS